MTNLQLLEKRIREILPSLQELTFGCEVEVDGIARDNPGCEKDVVVDSRLDEHDRVTLGYFGQVPVDGFTILGHPIFLHHVLQAIPNNRIECRLSTPFLLIVSYETAKSVQWNLTLPLSGQSEKTINFLLELLGHSIEDYAEKLLSK